MFKKVGKFLLLYLLLSLIVGSIVYIYDTFFGKPRWEWPTIFLAIGFPIGIISCNFCGFILSLMFLRKKMQIIIGYILFIINIISLTLQFEYTHGNEIILMNIISILIVFGIWMFDEIYRRTYFIRLINLDDDLFKKKFSKIELKELQLFFKRCKDEMIKNKYYTKIEQTMGNDYLNTIKEL